MLFGNCVIYKKSPCRPKVANNAYKERECQVGRCPGLGWVGAGVDISEGSATDRPSSQATYTVNSDQTKCVRKSCPVAGCRLVRCTARTTEASVCAGGSWILWAAPHHLSVWTDFSFFSKREEGETCSLLQGQCGSRCKFCR